MLIHAIEFATFTALLLAATGLLGMALLPRRLAESEHRLSLFLLCPLLGAAAWIALSVALAPLVGLTRPFVAGLAALFAGWVAFRRRRLFLPAPGRWLWPSLAALLLLVGLCGALLMPREIDGAIYFVPSMYDHVKCMIVRSIQEFGLPPINPWLADGGTPVQMAYYYGFHAWAAQLMMLTGAGSLFVEIAMTLATGAICTLATAGLAGLLCPSKKGLAIALAALLTLFADHLDVLRALLPDAVTSLPGRDFCSYWPFVDNIIWSPQHVIAATLVLAVAWLYLHMLALPDRRSAIPFALLVALLASAAAMASVYAGCLALAFMGLLVAGFVAADRMFRQDFLRQLPAQALAIAVAALLSAAYLLYLFQGQSGSAAPLAFGPDPCYDAARGHAGLLAIFLNFYLYVLPWRTGLPYLLAAAAFCIPGVLPRNRRMAFLGLFTALSLLCPFVLHSTFYTNDFGWRFIQPAQQMLMVFSGLLLVRLSERRGGWLPVLLLLAAAFFSGTARVEQLSCLRNAPGTSRALARAVPGWEAVRRIAGPREMVLSNPAGFAAIGGAKNVAETTNLFLSLFAERNAPIGDLVFAQCYSEFYDKDKLRSRFNRVTGIFRGGPSAGDADYLADDLKVKAILVTAEDGLFQDPGALASRYRLAEEADGYQVYALEEGGEP